MLVTGSPTVTTPCSVAVTREASNKLEKTLTPPITSSKQKLEFPSCKPEKNLVKISLNSTKAVGPRGVDVRLVSFITQACCTVVLCAASAWLGIANEQIRQVDKPMN
mmetsp:Transcript_1164/g.1398  ORF Transcript_1164/g.1398 Transcript_1164/m.1398 type:complete len:107 (-) Transcript_1164:96-416(-)